MTIGIVTISFNQARFLEEAVDSVSVLTPHRLEYVIVDPGSTDGSREIVERRRTQFSAAIMEPDQGPADGLNKGFAALKDADVCGYINADDRFAPGALDYVAGFFSSHPETDILLGSIRIIDECGRPSLRGRVVDKADLTRFANRTSYFWQQATFFRRSILERTRGFNPENRISWDSELIVDMLLAGARVAHTPRVLGDFRIYGASITGSGRLVEEATRQHRRVCAKIASAGRLNRSPLFSVWGPKLHQLAYRFSLRRQFGNLFIGVAARAAGTNSRSVKTL
ncbi:MAG TPA: glycosyltransferase family 2 protein [Candidatus Acidoferrales bacterium]|jgi:glycosyltransferase involved in cell wall biosynthesis|nr:glycosyltransferase family 2 protein [Candidatus Acidoferrales bacterium]